MIALLSKQSVGCRLSEAAVSDVNGVDDRDTAIVLDGIQNQYQCA